ncbi:MAG: STAS domain-containing protein [Verrucomicrobia bacterium]|nr:STAS domain-containing protein [Verrucomicrobiota bacterium]
MTPMVCIASADRNIWIKVVGRGNFQCSPCLKNLVQEQSAQGSHEYTIDLAECEQLDSTFMGTLTGIAQRLKKKKEGSLRVINVSESNQQLMKNLGLDQLFLIRSITEGRELPPVATQEKFSQVVEPSCASKKTFEETVRSAHEALVIANKENAPKFENLLEIIK